MLGHAPHPDDLAPMATMADAHSEWHRNAGIPMGRPGCPMDACHPYDWDDDEDETPAEPEHRIKCGACKGRHATTALVRSCHRGR